MINHPNRAKGRQRLYLVKLTLDEINAILTTSGNADAYAMSDDFDSEAAGQAFLDALQSATDKLNQAT